jgi:hypothetical protein
LSSATEPFDRPPLRRDVAALASQFDRRLRRVLDDNFAGFFLYGALTFPHPDDWHADVDFHVFVQSPIDVAARAAIKGLYADAAAASALGKELDGYFVTVDDARTREPPPDQLAPSVRDDAWALHRAHILAGRFFLISGLDPRTVVIAPSWDELDAGLRNELRFIEAHRQQRAFGILNACRVLYSLEHHDVVVSKYASATWARSAYPESHQAVSAAVRAYSNEADTDDEAILEQGWPAIVSRARAALDH